MITGQSKRGNELKPEDRRHVLAAYIYRNTHENIASHLDAVKQTGTKLPPISDDRWLEITEFAVKKDGSLNFKLDHCYTHFMEVPEWKAILDAWKPYLETKSA